MTFPRKIILIAAVALAISLGTACVKGGEKMYRVGGSTGVFGLS